MRLKEIENSSDFEEYLDDYLAHMAWHDKKPRQYDRTLLVEASRWIGWLNDDYMITNAYVLFLEKKLKDLEGDSK